MNKKKVRRPKPLRFEERLGLLQDAFGSDVVAEFLIRDKTVMLLSLKRSTYEPFEPDDFDEGGGLASKRPSKGSSVPPRIPPWRPSYCG